MANEFLYKAVTNVGNLIYTASREDTDGKPITDVAFKTAQPVQLSGSNATLDVKTKNQYPIETPIGFSWVSHPLSNRIFFDAGLNKYVTDFNVADLDPFKDGSGKTIYVDPVNGSDSNTGLSQQLAVKSAQAALTKNADTIYLMDGLYTRATGFPGTTTNLSRHLSIKALPGHSPILTPTDIHTWTKTAGQTNVYEVVRGAVWDVYDVVKVNDYGDYTKLVSKVSVAEVDSTPGSYYSDGTKVYIHLYNSRVPSGTGGGVRVNLSVSYFDFNISGSNNLYLEGLNIEGSRCCDLKNTDGLSNVYAKNCKFKYGLYEGGFRILGFKTVITQNCTAAKNDNDGFNYHANNGYICKAVEIDNIGRDNGIESDSDNGSTMHDGGKIVRFKGAYYRNIGPNVADVNDGTQSWNIGVIAYGSKSVSAVNGNTDFYAASGKIEMWIDNCVGYGSDKSLFVDADSKAYVRNSKLSLVTNNGKKYDY